MNILWSQGRKVVKISSFRIHSKCRWLFWTFFLIIWIDKKQKPKIMYDTLSMAQFVIWFPLLIFFYFGWHIHKGCLWKVIRLGIPCLFVLQIKKLQKSVSFRIAAWKCPLPTYRRILHKRCLPIILAIGHHIGQNRSWTKQFKAICNMNCMCYFRMWIALQILCLSFYL